MKRKWTMWGVLALILILGAAVVGVWGFMQTVLNSPASNATPFSVSTNETEIVALPGHVVYVMRVQSAVSIDKCEVTDPDGQSLAMKALNKTEVGLKEIYQFITTSDGDYSVTCTAKSDGRTVSASALITYRDYARSPLIWLAVLMFVASLVLARKQGAHTRAALAAAQNPPSPGQYPTQSQYPASGQYPTPGAGSPPQYAQYGPGAGSPQYGPGPYPGAGYPAAPPSQYPPGQYPPPQSQYPPSPGGYPG